MQDSVNCRRTTDFYTDAENRTDCRKPTFITTNIVTLEDRSQPVLNELQVGSILPELRTSFDQWTVWTQSHFISRWSMIVPVVEIGPSDVSTTCTVVTSESVAHMTERT